MMPDKSEITFSDPYASTWMQTDTEARGGGSQIHLAPLPCTALLLLLLWFGLSLPYVPDLAARPLSEPDGHVLI